jgi:hypothetical protein
MDEEAKMMMTFKIGDEPDHVIAINPLRVTYLKRNGSGLTWIHLSDGSKHLVYGQFDVVAEIIGRALEWRQE